MGPFKFLSSVFSSVANATSATLGAVESTANVVNHWADTAHEASKLTSEQMLDELRYENNVRSEELKAKLATLNPVGAQ